MTEETPMVRTMDEMKEYVAMEYHNRIDFKQILDREYWKIVEDLDQWTDEAIVKEYNTILEDERNDSDT